MNPAARLPSEDEIAARCGGNPLVALILLLDADPDLRRHFRREPAAMFAEFGLGCPSDFIGVRGRACPAMPVMPGGPADRDIADGYWASWLRGGVRQIDPYRSTLLPQHARLPQRHSLDSLEWRIVVARVKAVIAAAIAAIDS